VFSAWLLSILHAVNPLIRTVQKTGSTSRFLRGHSVQVEPLLSAIPPILPSDQQKLFASVVVRVRVTDRDGNAPRVAGAPRA
jgi:hypothetical protein